MLDLRISLVYRAFLKGHNCFSHVFLDIILKWIQGSNRFPGTGLYLVGKDCLFSSEKTWNGSQKLVGSMVFSKKNSTIIHQTV